MKNTNETSRKTVITNTAHRKTLSYKRPLPQQRGISKIHKKFLNAGKSKGYHRKNLPKWFSSIPVEYH